MRAVSISRAAYWIITLCKNVASTRGVTAFLSAFGALWLIVEIANYYRLFDTTLLQKSGWLFFWLGIGLVIWQCRPITSVKCRMSGRDVGLEIRVGNIFRQPGALVVGTNTTFDTRIAPNLISEQSLQGQFTRKYYPSDKDFDDAIEMGLTGIEFSQLQGQRVGKSREFPIGTTVQLRVKDGSADRTAFFVAMAKMNEHGSAKSTPEELKDALVRLWVFIGERATKGVLVVPVLGSRFGRLPQREEIVREMIQSFIAACAEGSFCERLVIVLHGDDVVENNIDLKALGEYLRHTCRYTKLETARGAPSYGTPVGDTGAAENRM